ncbi:MAG: PAS domain S-box protein [Zoogloeaceae bacterium]|nr:PAS domain S-box protein [Rhodocyclaceae bacterium]MCP5236039.1 PAS domain S-box protein [Zoogloeaceae bacterium]
MSPEEDIHRVARRTSVRGVVIEADDAEDVRRQKMARIILDSMYQFLGLLDVDGTVLEINQAALDGAGLNLADVVGKPFWQARWWAVSEEVRDRVRAMIDDARSGRFARCDFEVFGDQHGSRTIAIDFSLTPILDDDGRVAYLLPEGRNITEKIARSAELSRKNGELQAALERLRELDGYKTRFFANVSHELRTPLALILGPVDQLLKEGGSLSEREHFRLTAIQRNARALLQQVNNLLDLARIDAERMPMAYVHANVVALLRETVAGFEAAAADRGITLSLRGEPELYADVDRAKFVRVLSNLLSNAFKFTPAGGRIVCDVARVSHGRVLISVQDNGPGVPDTMKRHIFDRFTQAGDDVGTDGSGLGLSIVKEFVELHRGSVVALDAPGGGAIFQVELPVRAPAGAVVRAGGGAETPVASDFLAPLKPELPTIPETARLPGRPTLLVVEDNPDLRLFLYDVLSDEYNVVLRENGESAFLSAISDPPDLIVTDLMMPGWDGERFVKALRERPGFPNVPVLVLSARSDDALREKLLEHLVQDFLTKPFSAQELRARARNLVTVKRTVDMLQKDLNSQASDVLELAASLVASRKSLQRSLAAMQVLDRRWLGLYENTAVGIALADREGRILSANPALHHMLGYDPATLVGVSLVDITAPAERARTRRNVDGLVKGTFPSYKIQKRYEKQDGAFLWANVCVSRIPAVSAEGPMLAVIVEDISLRIQAERSLTTTRRELARVGRYTAMGELAASIAHEINQPLSAVITNSEAALRWLSHATPNIDEVVAGLKRVNRDARMASSVIARIRSFLQASELRRERVDVARMLDELLQMLQLLLAEAGVQVTVESIAPKPFLMADPVQLQQVLLNLIVNAADAMRDQPEGERSLCIAVTRGRDGGLLFSVSDSGPGVEHAAEARLFEAFYSTKPKGLGMGLAISRGIVENHGGRLWLDHGKGRGACFSFAIPDN